MSIKTLFLLMLAPLVLVTLLPSKASAIPVFARKYGFECTMCHSTYPRLNDFGQRFRMNGYQLPGMETLEKDITETSVPVAIRTSAGYNNDNFDSTQTSNVDVNEFQVNGVDILAGGLIGPDIGFMFVYPPEINSSRGVAGQNGAIESANVIFSNLGSTWFNIRAGKFEPAYVAFSNKRHLSISPYEIYDFTFPGGPAFSDNQVGVEFTGWGRDGFRYAFGILDGSETNGSDTAPSDYYVRAAYVFGPGEGQTAGQRIGVTGYFGQAKPLASWQETDMSEQSFDRWGVDASFNVEQWNLALQYLRSNDSSELWNFSGNVPYSGGFAEVTYTPTIKFAGFTRYDWVNASSILGDITRWTVGGRYYIEDNMALHLEWSRRNESDLSGSDINETLWTARLDFAI
ncbi:MAG: hypothetical protein NTY09_07485 [bacterium]|nr:hypothetical protein [bacterium]